MKTVLPWALAALVLAVGCLAVGCSAPSEDDDDFETVLLPSAASPLIALRVVFDAGSIYDPPGREGLAALTALMVRDAGTAHRDYSAIGEALYPMAASIQGWTDREVSVFAGRVHRERLADFTDVFLEVLLAPGFDEADFERNREQLLAHLESTLRSGDDELLGLETIQQVIFAGHPYGHAPEGTIAGLRALTVDDAENFYETHYTRSRLMLGVAGGYPEGYVDELRQELLTLPVGESGRLDLPAPPTLEGRRFTLVEKNARAVGLHLGYPLAVNRTDDDYYPLLIANSFLGEHRTLHGRLMQQLRETRGLNYGDYSYIEHWPLPPFTNNPLAGYPRRQQYFSVWLRPVVPGTEHFALRNALYEVERLLDRGLSEEEFEATRDFLIHYSKLWARDLDSRLGYRMDSAWYGMPSFIDEVEARLREVTRDQVQAAIRRHLQLDAFEAVIVTAGAADLQQRLEDEAPSPMRYPVEVPAEVREEDVEIEKVAVAPSSFRVVPVGQLFED